MYPQPELIRLAAHKAGLRRRIGARRVECAALLACALRPMTWLDRAVVLWRKISPFAKLATIPLALILRRTFFPRAKALGSLLRWGPGIVVALRGLKGR